MRFVLVNLDGLMVAICPWQFHSFPHNEYVHVFPSCTMYCISLSLSLWDIVSHGRVICSLLLLLFLCCCFSFLIKIRGFNFYPR